MIAINLLPYDLRPIKHTPLPYVLSASVLVLAVLVMGGMWLDTRNQKNAMLADLAKHQEELDGLAAIVEKYNKLSEDKVRLSEKMDIIREIVNDRIIWSEQLWNLSTLTPDNFWYNHISEQEKSTKEKRQVYNAKKKMDETKTVTVKRRILELGGYVIQGENASKDIYPLTFKLEQDPEFTDTFQWGKLANVEDRLFEGYDVREFLLEYLIVKGGEEEEP